MHKRIVEAVAAIEQETNGAVTIQVFSNSQLGSSVDMFSQVRSGALDMMTVSTPLGNTTQIAAIPATAFVFPTIEKAWEAMDGSLGQHLREVVSDQLGIFMFERIWDFGGYRHMTTSTKPITVPEDLRGMKIRLPVSPLYNSTFQAFGAAPVSINYVEVYPALQTGVADGMECPLALIDTGRFYEVQKYCSLTGHMWDPVTMVANGRTWENVPAELRDVIIRHMSEAALKQRADSVELNVTLQQQMSEKGLIFNDVDRAPFREALREAGYYAEWKSKFGDEAWAELERYTGSLT